MASHRKGTVSIQMESLRRSVCKWKRMAKEKMQMESTKEWKMELLAKEQTYKNDVYEGEWKDGMPWNSQWKSDTQMEASTKEVER